MVSISFPERYRKKGGKMQMKKIYCVLKDDLTRCNFLLHCIIFVVLHPSRSFSSKFQPLGLGDQMEAWS